MTTREIVGVRLRDVPKLLPDQKNLPAVVEALREVAQTFRGYRGDPLDRALTLRDLTPRAQQTVLGVGGSGSGTIGEDGGVPDLTPPPTPSGLVVTAGVTYLYISCDSPVYTQGNGHDMTVVYGAKWPLIDPTPPTFSEAVEIFRFDGEFGAYPTDTDSRWCVWIKWRSRDGIESTSPAGGTNGAQATTGLVNTPDIALNAVDNLRIASVSAGKITAGSLSVGAYIQSTGFTPGNPGFRIDGDGGVEIRSVGGTRIFNLNASGTQPVLQVGSALQVLANGAATFAGALSAATGTFSGSLSAATGTFSGAISASTISGTTITGGLLQTDANPLNERITINESGSNEARYYGDRGDGTVELLASTGISTATLGDNVVGKFGSISSTRTAIMAESTAGYFGILRENRSMLLLQQAGAAASDTNASWAVNILMQGRSGIQLNVTGSSQGISATSAGGTCIRGFSASGNGIEGQSSSGYGGHFSGNATRGAIFLTPVTTAPSNTTLGALAIIRNPSSLKYNLCWCRDGAWVTVDGQIAWNDPVDTGGGT